MLQGSDLCHPTHTMQDSTKLDDYERCPRLDFWRHIAGWGLAVASVHLNFGAAIHKAMDYLITHGVRPANVDGAFNAFMQEWLARGERAEVEPGPKTPMNARLALEAYVARYEQEDADIEPGQIEVPGLVPVTEDWSLYVNIDRVTKNRDGRWIIWDHKTASALTDYWQAQWVLHAQFNAYVHALACVVPIEEVEGVLVNGLILRYAKSGKGLGNDFVRVPVRKLPQDIAAWHSDTCGLLRDFEMDLEECYNCCSSRPQLHAFRKRPGSCTKYNSLCPYHFLCSTGENPLKLIERYGDCLPDGMEKKFWNPAKARAWQEGDSNA